jgi:23S rRNA pseudouridine1911/1915/1917 synthase
MHANATQTEYLSFFDSLWPVLYADNHLLAVYKPSGLLVQGDRTGDVCLLDLGKRWLKKRYNKPGKVFLAMVHRLDRPVAGVVLFARTSKAASRLSRQFRERSVEKQYLAVVRGTVCCDNELLIDHIEHRDRVSRVVPTPTDKSQEARLRYTVLGKNDEQSLLRIFLETGRRHQIRIQLAQLGHPILGDLRYGASTPLPGRQIALLAQKLRVDHPTRGDRLVITSPVPRQWPWLNDEKPCRQGPPWDWRAFDSVIRATAGLDPFE